MANHGNISRTMTVHQIQNRCQDLVLRLTDPTNRPARSEVEAVVNGARKDVDARFYKLVEKYVIDQNRTVHHKLLESLKLSPNPEQFLESFIINLYRKAVEEEEAIALQSLNDEEKRRLRKMQGNDWSYHHGGDANNHYHDGSANKYYHDGNPHAQYRDDNGSSYRHPERKGKH